MTVDLKRDGREALGRRVHRTLARICGVLKITALPLVEALFPELLECGRGSQRIIISDDDLLALGLDLRL